MNRKRENWKNEPEKCLKKNGEEEQERAGFSQKDINS